MQSFYSRLTRREIRPDFFNVLAARLRELRTCLGLIQPGDSCVALWQLQLECGFNGILLWLEQLNLKFLPPTLKFAFSPLPR